MFDKPKDWGIAPKSEWVSGKVIGESEAVMPKLGDPDFHLKASSKMSFADEGVKEEPDSPETALFRGRQVNQCPAGTSNENGICTPNPKSEASVESRVAASTRNGQQWESKVKSPMERQRDSLKRELPKAKQDLTQVRKLTKEGVKSRIGQ